MARSTNILIGIIGIFLVSFLIIKASSKPSTEEIIKASRGDVRQEVITTGKVQPASAINLSFETGGKVSVVNKAVGETVKTGDVIVKLDSSDLSTQRSQLVARVSLEQAKLSALEKASSSEQYILTLSSLTKAKAELEIAEKSLVTSTQTAYSLANDAIKVKADQLFIDPASPSPQLKIQTSQSEALIIYSGRIEVEKRLNELLSVSKNTATATVAVSAVSITQDLAEIKLFLDNLAVYVNGLSQQSQLSADANTMKWNNDLTAARTEINTAITTILSAQNVIKLAQTNVATIQQQLISQQSNSVSSQLQIQRALLAQARASVTALDTQIAKRAIISPINGIIAKQDGRVGETISSSTIVVSIISEGQFDIQSYIPESDIASITIGRKAEVTLDAYGPDTIFQATVATIEPTETQINNLPTYRAIFTFTEQDQRIKSGMTASIHVIGDSRENVVQVPEKALVSRAGKKYVLVKNGNKIIESEVITGLRGSDGAVEIVSGLNEYDQVVLVK